MKKLLVLATVALLVPTQGRAIPGYAEMHCAEAIAAGGTNLVANVQCVYHLLVEKLDPELCPFCET